MDKNDDYLFLKGDAFSAARRLLGCDLVRTVNGQSSRIRIVETEAYDESDAASHSYKKMSARTEIMFGEAGHLYVYFTYGMHYCCNIVVGKPGYGAAVLIRAVEPLEGIEQLRTNRIGHGDTRLTNGPAKLCQALQIDKLLNGHNLLDKPLQLLINPALTDSKITETKRVGISRGKDALWRFYITGNSFISKK